MITLITGGPGLGKTALAVKIIITQYQNRPLFTNINGLTLDHSPLPKIEEWTTEKFNDQGTSDHRFTFPAGSVIVIDEAQQFFRPRSTGSRVPPYVSAFETHRHQGIEFILITQGSGLLDTNIRKLVKGGLHIYLKSSYVGRFRYEKSEVISEDDRTSYTLATRRKYTLPKEVFSLYKSAELHTKPPRAKLPLAAYFLAFAVIGVVFGVYRTVYRVDELTTKPEPKNGDKGVAVAQQRPALAPMTVVTALPKNLIEAMTPVDDHDYLSAPIYAEVKPKVTPPEIKGCIASKKNCSCYSQQNTPIWLPQEQCRSRAAGNYYDPYLNPPHEDKQDLPIRQAVTPTDVPRSPEGAAPPSGAGVSVGPADFIGG